MNLLQSQFDVARGRRASTVAITVSLALWVGQPAQFVLCACEALTSGEVASDAVLPFCHLTTIDMSYQRIDQPIDNVLISSLCAFAVMNCGTGSL